MVALNGYVFDLRDLQTRGLVRTIGILAILITLSIGSNVFWPRSASAAPVASLISVVVGTDGNLYWSPFTTSWGPWTSLEGQSRSSPGLCVSNSTKVELVVRGPYDGIYHKSFTGTVWQPSWDRVPTGLTFDSPVCAVLGSTLYVAVRGTAGELWTTTFDLNTRIWAATWTNQGLGPGTPTVPALVATPASSRLDLVVMTYGNAIFHKAFTGGAWSTSWDFPTGAAAVATPAIASDGSNIQVVVRGGGSGIWYSTLSFAGVWSSFISLDGSTPNAPTLVIDSANTLHLLVRGFDAQLYSKSKTSTGAWDGTWVNAGGVLANVSPAAAVIGSSASAVVIGVRNELWSDTLSGASWSGYVDMNGQSTIAPAVSAI